MNPRNAFLVVVATASVAFGWPSKAQEIGSKAERVKAPLTIKARCVATDAVSPCAMALSKDNARIVLATPEMLSATKDDEDAWKTVRVWDIRQGKRHKALTGHEYAVNRVSFSKDGAKVVGAGIARRFVVRPGQDQGPPETEVVVWDLMTEKLENRFRVKGYAEGLSAAGDKLLTILEKPGKVMVFAIGKDCKEIFSANVDGGVLGGALSRNGSTIAAIDNRATAHVWEVEDGKKKAHFQLGPVPADQDPVSLDKLFLSHDASKLWSAGAGRGGTWSWSVPERKFAKSYGVEGKAVSADGKYLMGLYVIPREIALLSCKTGKRVAELEYDNQKWAPMCLAIASDRSIAVAAGTPDGMVAVWDLPKDLPE